ncbi:MAG: hypothetical protein ACRDCB_13620 [Clostridium sp.]|uniref:hypothetical protein n=1 Tax=Clostridium TaxID=1485 RepID=UPI0018841024|nr:MULTISPECIES: hypothetical protein [Clostridium]MCR6514757.1 hypothetical protein [Clostridium sp. LY3-2]
MEEKILELIEEYKGAGESLEHGLEWLPTNDSARAKIDVLNMVIEDLQNLSKE